MSAFITKAGQSTNESPFDKGYFQPKKAASSGDFHLQFVVLDPRAVQLGNNAIGMFGGNIDKQVPLANVHRTYDLRRQSGFAQDGAHDVTGRDAHLPADVHVK